jgi:hypothetical protein
MPTVVNHLLVLCFVLAVVLVAVDAVRNRNLHKALLCLLPLSVAALALFAGPFQSSWRPFGNSGTSPIVAISLMFVGVLLGIVATYVFNLKGSFSFQEFVRPIVISPLVLLPLIGSVQGAALEPVQLVCFTVLAFQNGFFWQQVLRDAKPKI